MTFTQLSEPFPMNTGANRPIAKTRRKHTNSKLGCLNCKRKKIKCDENLPRCNNCRRGRLEICSYLTLSSSGINQILSTHTLKRNQAKLLADYNVPKTTFQFESLVFNAPKDISSSTLLSGGHPPHPQSFQYLQYPNYSSVPSQSALMYHKANHDVSPPAPLEIRFELDNLKLKIPQISYPPLRFDVLTMKNFDDEFKANDVDVEETQIKKKKQKTDENVDYGSINSVVHVQRILAFGQIRPTSFSKINYRGITQQFNDTPMDKINMFLINIDDSDRLMNQSLIVLGQIIISNQMKNINKFNSNKFNIKSINSLKRSSLKKFNSLLSTFESILIRLENSDNQTISQRCLALSLINYCLVYSNLLINRSTHSLIKLNSNILKIFRIHYKFNNDKNNQYIKELTSIINKDIITINLPSYDPSFLIEIVKNLSKFEKDIFNIEDNKKFKLNENFSQCYDKLVMQYHDLLGFLKLDLLPIMNKNRNEISLTTYSSSLILTLLKKWTLIYPHEMINYNVNYIPNTNSLEGLYLKDLTVCLYIHYNCISIILDSLFPSSNYLFNLKFNFDSFAESHFSKYMMVDKINPITNNDKNLVENLKISDFLQRNNFLNCRIYSFFKLRKALLYNFSTWQNFLSLNPNLSINERLKSRVVKNFLEIPITNFNNTFIRPQHYPRSIHNHYNSLLKDKLINLIYSWEDDSMNQKMFARNTETLNFFQPNCLPQFDQSSKLLLNDYRIEEDLGHPINIMTSPDDLANYLVDRHLILLNDSQ